MLKKFIMKHFIAGAVAERKKVVEYLSKFADEYRPGSDEHDLLRHLSHEIAQSEHWKGGQE